jgi:putative cardiolipin synthase
LIIDSPQLAREIAARFEAIAQPANSYKLLLDAANGGGPRPLRWLSAEEGKTRSFDVEPGVDAVKRGLIETLSLLPLDDLL